VSEQNYSLEAQANHLVQEKMRKWEETKNQKEKQLEAEIQNRKNAFEKEIIEKLKAIELEEKNRKEEMELEDKKRKEENKQEQQKVEQMRIEFDEEKRKMEKFEREQNSQVKLNVGGKIFETSIATLTKFPSMLQSMFSGRYENKLDSNGCIFVDSDGELFGIILNFLRRGVLPDNVRVNKKALLAEAEHFQLKVLEEMLKKI